MSKTTITKTTLSGYKAIKFETNNKNIKKYLILKILNPNLFLTHVGKYICKIYAYKIE